MAKPPYIASRKQLLFLEWCTNYALLVTINKCLVALKARLPLCSARRSVMETDTVVLNEDGKQKKGNNIIREGIAILFWMYILTKLFVFDFDIWVMAKFFPEYLWFLNYKSLFWLVL